ncbi:MAG: hypothetical protein Q7T07_18605 [Burkholderiaceae bacterium]|nr:hypothetical protein [Burkholderiaceae bacterium]
MLIALLGGVFCSTSQAKTHEAEMANAAAVQAIYAAVFAHENWNHQLHTFVEHASKEVLTTQEVSLADRTGLGKWIHSIGKAKFAHYSDFKLLMEHHKMFQYAAENVVNQVDAGKNKEANHLLASQFEYFSDAIIADLLRLRDVVESTWSGKKKRA